MESPLEHAQNFADTALELMMLIDDPTILRYVVILVRDGGLNGQQRGILERWASSPDGERVWNAYAVHRQQNGRRLYRQKRS